MKNKPSPFADSVPMPHAEELGHDTGWALWTQEVERAKRTFAPTQPMTALATFGAGFAPTQPAPVPLSAGAEAAQTLVRPAVTLERVMQLARHRNRVCPVVPRWLEFHALLSRHARSPRDVLPEPLEGAAWSGTPSLAKRMVFRDQIEWAERHGCLAEAHAFLQNLPDSGWHHMGR